MPPRRRGKSTTARAAAIQAVQRKRRAQQSQHHDDHNCCGGGGEEDSQSLHHHNHHHAHSLHHNKSDGNPHSHSHNHNHLHAKRNVQRQGKKRSHREDEEEEEEDEDDFSSENEEEGDDDCPPPLVGNDEEFCDGEEEDVDDEDEEDDDDAAVGDGHSSNTMSGEGGCLHCHKGAPPSDIQVRCDECQAYICQNCHWCHEFQANHEIRVCDRCDAFYCRTCDEMDQCDDCGEVVCASCSTLLSCKFCGGGLCEECATACGRCGIVLCSRDAKFAVDCDTCRLSYCLVCLASGSKDPCVRCGHRPSKRMEQLVHLRLKSIYKAFKQSSRNSKYGGGNTGEGNDDDEDDDEDVDLDEDDDTETAKGGDPQSLLQAAASAASKHSGSRANNSRHSSSAHAHSHHHHHHAAAAAASASSSHHHHPTSAAASKRAATNPGKSAGSASASTISRDQQAKEMVNKYMAEKEKADAAAAALLAELDEEEEAVKSKKNKKKRKKERQLAKKEEELKKNQPPEPEPQKPISSPSRQRQQQLQQEQNMNQQMLSQLDDDDNEEDDSDIEIIDIAKPSSNSNNNVKNGKKKKKKKGKKTDEDSNNKTSSETMSAKSNEKSETASTEDGTTAMDDKPEAPAIDPVEQQLCQCVADEDVEGIEHILATLKGVPGRAPLRKNAKKALKKLKAEQEEAAAAEEAERVEEAKKKAAAIEKQLAFKEVQATRSASGAGTPATHSETNSTGVTNRNQPPPPLPPNELFRLVSVTHGKPVTVTMNNPGQRPTKGQSNTSSSTPATRSESVMHIAYNVVGWVIGKGGQRIRDLMEESGARVWIDQEHLSEKDPRIVYVSGGRKQVEAAVKLIKELVGKAPVPGGGTVAEASMANTGPPPAPVLQLAERASIVLNRADSRTVTQKPEVEFKKEPLEAPPRSFQEAAASASNADGGINPLSSLQFKAGDVPIMTIDGARKAAASEKQQLKVTTTVDGNIHEHEMTCEACFVPLLIGRRGWTIKHIQDSSGARVDIDQTVTPRKVKISGNEENVQTAIRMVRDVLSYPHAQLQGAAESLEDLEHPPEGLPARGGSALDNLDQIAAAAAAIAAPSQLESAAATLSNTTTVNVSNQVVAPPLQESPAMVARTAVERVHTPPPSSHINIGDAKSTISASSSLSSTPEPSMASSSKGHYMNAGTPGPVLPQEYGGSYPQQQQQQQPALGQPSQPQQQQQQHANIASSNLFGQQNSLHQMNLNNITDSHGGSSGGVLPAQQHVSPPLFPGRMAGAGMTSVSPRHEMQSGLPRGFPHPNHRQHQSQQQSMLLGQAVLRGQQQQQRQAHMRSMNGLGGMPHQSAQYPPRPESHAVYQQHSHHSSLQYPGGMANRQQQASLHLHQQSAFHPSEHKQMRQHSAPEMFHPTGDIGVGNVVDHRNKPGGYVPPGMWSNRGSSLVLGADNRGQHGVNPMQGRQASDLRLNSGAASLGLGFGFSASGGANSNMRQNDSRLPGLSSSGKDDSRMVDSLFGPSEGKNEEKSLVTGFQGLSFGDDGGLSSDMWSKNLSQQGWEGETNKGSSALFSAIQPNRTAQEVQHPSKSRFIWGASESQGHSA